MERILETIIEYTWEISVTIFMVVLIVGAVGGLLMEMTGYKPKKRRNPEKKI